MCRSSASGSVHRPLRLSSPLCRCRRSTREPAGTRSSGRNRAGLRTALANGGSPPLPATRYVPKWFRPSVGRPTPIAPTNTHYLAPQWWRSRAAGGGRRQRCKGKLSTGREQGVGNNACLWSWGATRIRQGSPRRPQRSDGRDQGEEGHETCSVGRRDDGVDGEDAGRYEPEADRYGGPIVHHGREPTGPLLLAALRIRADFPVLVSSGRAHRSGARRRNPAPAAVSIARASPSAHWCRTTAPQARSADRARREQGAICPGGMASSRARKAPPTGP